MWKCVKCETNNEDSQAVCGICGMKMMVSRKICYERSLNEKKAESDAKAAAETTAEKKIIRVYGDEVHGDTEKKIIRHDGTFPASDSDIAGKNSSVTRLEELEESMKNVDTFCDGKKHRGINALEIVMIIVAILLLVVIAAVCIGIFVLF
ncbi:MAG: hypothetical protein ACI4JN_01605 [Ruminococcus sp.]